MLWLVLLARWGKMDRVKEVWEDRFDPRFNIRMNLSVVCDEVEDELVATISQ